MRSKKIVASLGSMVFAATCFVELALLLLSARTVGGAVLNPHLLVFGKVIYPPMQSIEDSLRMSSADHIGVEPPSMEAHATENIYRTMQQIKTLVASDNAFSDKGVYVHADVLRNGEWFETQSLSSEKLSYSFTIPCQGQHQEHAERPLDTRIWLSASAIIPDEILQVCGGGYLVIVSSYNYTELQSSYHAKIDLDLFPESWIHTECISFDKGSEDSPSYAMRRYSYKETKVWTSKSFNENPFQLIWILGFFSVIMYSILILFSQGKSFEEIDTGSEGASRRWERNKQNGRLDKV